MAKKIALFALAFASLFASCKKSASLYPEYFEFQNGLSVFVREDHKVPLAYIEIAVRAGGVTQRRDNTGIFHLYEHMMFKGNSMCKDSAAFQKTLSELGVDWRALRELFFHDSVGRLEEGNGILVGGDSRAAFRRGRI